MGLSGGHRTTTGFLLVWSTLGLSFGSILLHSCHDILDNTPTLCAGVGFDYFRGTHFPGVFNG